ncbi:unknown [Cryptobacterium sp. CAG:338]|nr:unknown [Cryptobacterium sp. CAG:338]
MLVEVVRIQRQVVVVEVPPVVEAQRQAALAALAVLAEAQRQVALAALEFGQVVAEQQAAVVEYLSMAE